MGGSRAVMGSSIVKTAFRKKMLRSDARRPEEAVLLMESALGTGTRHRASDEAQRRLCCASGPTLNSGPGRLARAFKLPWGPDTRVPQVGSTTGRGFLVNRPCQCGGAEAEEARPG